MAQKIEFPNSTSLLILGLLESGDKYGYQMIRALELRSDRTFFMQEGMLYPILHRLERQGDIRSYMQSAATGRTRKYYQLTRQGVRSLSHKRQEWTLLCQKFGKIAGGEACDKL